MKLALDTTLSPIAMTNSDLALTYVNKAMCTIFGYAEDEMVGRDIGMVMDDATRAEHHAASEEFQKTGNCDAIVVVGREVQGRHKDGRTLHLRLSRNVTDDRKLFVMSFQDMSAAIAQRESERKLKQHAFLRSLYAAMSGTIAYEVANQGIEWVAGATASILGYNHEEWKVMHPLLVGVVVDAVGRRPSTVHRQSAVQPSAIGHRRSTIDRPAIGHRPFGRRPSAI